MRRSPFIANYERGATVARGRRNGETGMDRRTFLLGLFGGLAAAAGLSSTGGTPALALSPVPTPAPDGLTEAADIKPEDLDGVTTERTQYWRRRRRRHYRRYWRRRRRYWRRRYWRRRFYPRYWRRRRRYWRRRYW